MEVENTPAYYDTARLTLKTVLKYRLQLIVSKKVL